MKRIVIGLLPVLLTVLLWSCGNRTTGEVVYETEYYEDGMVRMEGGMKDGKREGEWTAYFPDGKVQSTGTFKNGLRTGKATVYYSNGQLYMEGMYKEGHHCGKWTYYDEQGYALRTDDYGE